MKVTNILIVSLVILGIGSQQGVIAKTFKKCDLARELARMGYSMSSLPDWICLIASESSFNTAAVGGPNTDGSFDWGLYQINDRYWCTKGRRGGECNIDCKDLIDDNIEDDSECAKMIFRIHGYDAWYGWQKKCKGQALPSVKECFQGYEL